jgi:hypothetical protein
MSMEIQSVPLLSALADPSRYLDPGSGSFLLQLLIAGLAGMGLFIGASWKRIRRVFQKKKDQYPPEEEEEEYDD